MNILTNPLMLAVIFAWGGYYFWINVWNKKSDTVMCYMYDYIDHEAVLLTQKPIKARIKVINGGSTLILPKRWSDRPMPGPQPDNLIPNSSGVRMVHLVRIEQDGFTYMKASYKLRESYNQLKLLDNNYAFWAANEIEKAHLRNTTKDKFAWVKANAVAIIMLVIAFMVLVYGIKTTNDMTMEASKQNIESSKQILNQIDGIKQYLTGGENVINKETIDSDVDIPPGRTNVAHTS